MNTNARTLKLLEAIADQLAPPLGRESLPRSSDSKQRILQTTEEIARVLGILPALPSGEDMATVTYSIGTSGRDYSTITAWEADLDNGALYSSGDIATGELYNDSAFDESLTVDGGTTAGLTQRVLQSASGEGHDGTAGTGARFVMSSGGTIVFNVNDNIATTLTHIEVNFNGQDWQTALLPDTNLNQIFTRLLVHGIESSTQTVRGVRAGGCIYANCIVYDLLSTSTGAGSCEGFALNGNSSSAQYTYNCTAWNITNNNGNGNALGFTIPDNANKEIINNVGGGCGGTSSGAHRPYSDTNYTNATCENNASDDTSASGTNVVENIVGADSFVSVVGGSEDLHLKTGSALIDAGQDLGSTAAYAIDIDGRNRDTEGDTWDIGAHEFVSGGGPAPSGGFPYQIYYG